MNEKQTITLLFLSGVMLSLGMLSLYLNSAPGEPLVVDVWTGASTVKISPGLPVKKEISLLDIAKGNPNILKSPPKKFSDFYKVGFSAKGISQEELRRISRYYGFPDDLLYYQNMIESSGGCIKKPNRKGAVGCFQFLQGTAREFGLMVLDIDTKQYVDFRSEFHASADAAARYMLWLTVILYGDDADPSNWEQLKHVLASYNAGYARVINGGKPRVPRFYETIRYVHYIESLVKREAVWVERGDSLAKISSRTGVSVDMLIRGNPLIGDGKRLRAGTVLSLPDKMGMTKVVVKKGMNLYSIQTSTGVPISSLVSVNNISQKNTIRVGDVLKLPILDVVSYDSKNQDDSVIP